MSTRGIGAQLLSAFGTVFIGRSTHLTRQDLAAGDTDDAEVSMWEDWFFEAAAAPEAGDTAIAKRAMHLVMRRVA